MGRHGGGSRSGGSSGGRSGGGSRGGGSARTSKTPFRGCYNRSYYDRRGHYHSYYTSNSRFGTTSGWTASKVLIIIFITLHMVVMMGGFLISAIDFGGKVDGDSSRIFIVDNAKLLTSDEEAEVLALFDKVYEATGMPITLYTDDFSWKKRYLSLEIYSEELYYQIGFDEDAMLILFTAGTINGFDDWEYDMYCGDDTEKCFSDEEFDTVLSNFQKGMAGQNLAEALDYAWNSVMDDIGKFNVNWSMLFALPVLALFYGAIYFSILGSTIKESAAHKYFKENPNELSMMPMNTIYSACPNCGASNTTGKDTCQYCGTFLKVKQGNTQYIHPDNPGF